jgi:hypothetical protein
VKEPRQERDGAELGEVVQQAWEQGLLLLLRVSSTYEIERGRGEGEKREKWAEKWGHRHVASTSIKRATKTAHWSFMNGFKS